MTDNRNPIEEARLELRLANHYDTSHGRATRAAAQAQAWATLGLVDAIQGLPALVVEAMQAQSEPVEIDSGTALSSTAVPGGKFILHHAESRVDDNEVLTLDDDPAVLLDAIERRDRDIRRMKADAQGSWLVAQERDAKIARLESEVRNLRRSAPDHQILVGVLHDEEAAVVPPGRARFIPGTLHDGEAAIGKLLLHGETVALLNIIGKRDREISLLRETIRRMCEENARSNDAVLAILRDARGGHGDIPDTPTEAE